MIIGSCSCIFRKINGKTGNAILLSKELNIKDYDAIHLTCSGDVEYRQDTLANPYLQISIDKNLYPYLKIDVVGNTLEIGTEDHLSLNPSQFKIFTNSKNIRDVLVEGSGDVVLKGQVNSKELTIEITGSGDVSAEDLLCEKAEIRTAGSGDITLKGSGTEAIYKVEGSGDINNAGFSTQDLECYLSGSGDVKAYVNRDLKAYLLGSGDLYYKGAPKNVIQSVKGSGDISKM